MYNTEHLAIQLSDPSMVFLIILVENVVIVFKKVMS